MPYRVVHGGTGITGREGLAGIIKDPDLVLVGVLATTPEKIGQDAGSLCNLPDTGVIVTGSFDEIIALKPDCFCYCGNVVGREGAAIEDMARLLEAGINVVTIATIPMIYAPAAHVSWVNRIEAACERGGTSFYATGSEPGLCSMAVPAAMLGGAGEVDEYRMDLYATTLDASYPLWEVLHESMAFGKPEGHVPARISSHKVEHDWIVVVRYLADILDITLDSVEVDWETLVAETDLTTAMPDRIITAGTISGHRWRLAGMVDGKPKVAVQYFASFTTTPWPEHWGVKGNSMTMRVKGRPSMEVLLKFDPNPEDKGKMSPLVFTAMAVVNAIPHIVDSASGIITDPVMGRGVISRLNRRQRKTHLSDSVQGIC